MKQKKRRIFLSLLLIPCATLVLFDSTFFLLQILWKPFYQSYIDDNHKFYLYTLGESTALGVHYGGKIAPIQLVSYQFNDTLQGKPIQTISLAESGQTIEYNYYKFYFETLFRPHRNALVFIYSGINENIENTPDPNIRYWQWIQHSTTLSKLVYMLNIFENSPQKYAFRYQQIVDNAKALGYKTVISQLVGNISDFDPDVSLHDILQSPTHKPLLDSADSNAAKVQWPKEKAALVELQKKLPGMHPYLRFRLGQNQLKQMELDSAAAYLWPIPETNEYLGYAGWKNKILEQVARQKDVALARTFDRFMDSSNHQLVGYNLIDDAHHPNIKGYSIMSTAIAQQIAQLTGDTIKRSISPEFIIAHFNLANHNQSTAYYNLVEWYMFEILKTQFPKHRLARMKYYMTQYKTLNPKDETQLLWEMFVAIFEQNDFNFTKAILSIDRSPRKKELIERMNWAFADEERKQTIMNKAKSLKMDNTSVQSTFALFFK